jgi:hypothetical protein
VSYSACSTYLQGFARNATEVVRDLQMRGVQELKHRDVFLAGSRKFGHLAGQESTETPSDQAEVLVRQGSHGGLGCGRGESLVGGLQQDADREKGTRTWPWNGQKQERQRVAGHLKDAVIPYFLPLQMDAGS